MWFLVSISAWIICKHLDLKWIINKYQDSNASVLLLLDFAELWMMMWLLPRLQPFSMQPYCHLLRLGGTARLSAPCCAFRAISFTLVSHVLFIGGSSAISARCNCANASSGLFKELIKKKRRERVYGIFFSPPPSGSAASCHCRPQRCVCFWHCRMQSRHFTRRHQSFISHTCAASTFASAPTDSRA